jgi:aminoglycoside phosphotransferase (APT) family kinase protein
VAIWEAQQRVDEDGARALIHAQFAPLPCESVELVSAGWDYVVHRVDGAWAFRFPRRESVVAGTEREIAVLPRLAPLLPVAIPSPTHVGRPEPRFPWPFYGARFLPGAEPDPTLDDEARGRLARPLARVLRALHAPAALAAAGELLPFDPIGRADMKLRVPRTRDALAELVQLGAWEPPAEVEVILEEALGLLPAEPSAVVHGDLHFRQLLVDAGELTGLVDWVDACRSDPGVDLAIVWSFLPPLAREDFFAEYGAPSAASLLRGRVLALFLCAVLARYARAEGLARVEAEAVASLHRCLLG